MRRLNRHDLRHEELARAIERIERQRAEHNADRVPPFESSGAKKAPRERGLSFEGTSNHRICGMIGK